MDINSDTSVLSDDLKPRRTPTPSSFVDTVPRPSVPDLSIIETAEPRVASPLPVTSAVSQPLYHLSYNDWRQRTGGSNQHAVSSVPGNHAGLSAFKPQGVVAAVNNAVVTKQKVEYERENNHLSQPVGLRDKMVSYSYFGQRPSTAPVIKPPAENGMVQDHPFSKSAPPVRLSNHHHLSETGQMQSVHQCNSLHQNPTNLNAGSHGRGGIVSLPNNQNYSYPNSRKTCQSVIPDQNSSPLTSRKHPHGIYEIPNKVGSHITGPAMHPIKNYVLSSDSSSYHVSPIHSGEHVQNSCLLECCQASRKNHGPCPCGERVCCSTTAPLQPHLQNHIHSVPCIGQHISPSQVSYNDLYKIVLAQNDQLKALQTQVERLLVTQDQRAVTEFSGQMREKLSNSKKRFVAEEGTQTSDCDFKDEDSQKMSIGVMTSFVHAVTYTQKGARIDTMRNMSERSSNSNPSKSPSSDDYSSSSSPGSKESVNSCSKCCKGCSTKNKDDHKTRKQSSKAILTSDNAKNGSVRNSTCPDGCNCNNPGVSAAITAVRGCQAVLASRAGVTGHDFSTLAGAELPTVTEQQVSPVSSIHVELQEYHSSSGEGSSSSDSCDDSSFDGNESPRKDQEPGLTPNGWTFYNNVLGQVNKILEERDVANCNNQQVVPLHPPKQTDVSVSKRVAFEHQETDKTPQDLKEMAIKFLKENYPEELASSDDPKKLKKPCGEKVKEMSVYNMPASNMSFATFRYLERYNLLPENFNPQQYLETATNMQGFQMKSRESNHHPLQDGGSKKHFRQPSAKSKLRASNHPRHTVPDAQYQRQLPGVINPHGNTSPYHHPASRMQPQPNTPTSKILDITTLRQQPKLL